MYNTRPIDQVKSQKIINEIVNIKRQILLHGIINGFPKKITHHRLLDLNFIRILRVLPKNSVITGSNALYLYGLIDRKPKDFDIISSLSNVDKFINTSKARQKALEYGEIGLNSGVLSYTYNYKTDIDFFTKENYTEYNQYFWGRLDHLEAIIQTKASFGREKDLNDLKKILQKLSGL
jgi:hypothetical protein